MQQRVRIKSDSIYHSIRNEEGVITGKHICFPYTEIKFTLLDKQMYILDTEFEPIKLDYLEVTRNTIKETNAEFS